MANVRPIQEVANDLGIRPEHQIPYGDSKAKIRLAAQDSGREPGKLVLVTAVTPTSAGEGKTTSSIALGQGLAKIGEQVCVALREPSLGPIFGKKGGATGGGKSIVVPQDDINLHFTGDFHAISTANNLLAALLDNHLKQGNPLNLDPRRVLWRRVVDLNDRALRQVIVGLGGVSEGVPRETGFDITPASEVMAALCLSEDYEDLRDRLGRILVGQTHKRQAVTAGELQAVGSMMVVLKDALQPNLVQTIEGVPTLMHGGPFANIAHGCNSVVATKMALAHADWVITEAGFGADLGMEKFFDIKCRTAGLDVVAVVVVATIRALKRHGGVKNADLGKHDPAAVERGLDNLRKHVENVKLFGKTPIVTLNHFTGDSDDEVEVVRAAAEELGVAFAVHKGFAEGGEGAVELARTLVEHAESEPTPFRPVYELDQSIREKMEAVATKVYGARSVQWTATALKGMRIAEKLGLGNTPLCVAKTQMSFSDDPSRAGRPTDFDITVRDLVVSAGAGFVVPLVGDLMRMPGLPKTPQAHHIDLVDGEIVGMV